MSSSTIILSFENVKQLRMFATFVVGIATIFCRGKKTCYVVNLCHKIVDKEIKKQNSYMLQGFDSLYLGLCPGEVFQYVNHLRKEV